MRRELCLLTLVGSSVLLAAAEEALPSFAVFVQTYSRGYAVNSAEYRSREALYARRVEAARRQNSRADRLWTARANALWDRTEEEWACLTGQQHLDLAVELQEAPAAVQHNDTNVSRSVGVIAAATEATAADAQRGSLPTGKSWEHLAVWSQVIKDQGNCGSCWALAATTVLQAHSEIYSPKPRTFSAQELVSCMPNPRRCGGTGGCKGATMGLAMDWVLRNGVVTAAERPYDSGWKAETGTCRKSSFLQNTSDVAVAVAEGGRSKSRRLRSTQQATLDASEPSKELAGYAFGMRSWEKLVSNKYYSLVSALVNHGPLGVSVAPGGWSQYGSGIYTGCRDSVTVSHAVVLLAYGEEAGTMYWKVQNTWGTSWGEPGGRMRLLRRGLEEEKRCGINTHPEWGTGCQGGPSQVTVCGECGILYSPILPYFERPEPEVEEKPTKTVNKSKGGFQVEWPWE
eukprot:TRINITY_DN29181_c0_g1_i1.p1 TRINITY_DN29181_c0_g1~~TRINITY_DN29181_c0_g1_i1.p1  ORF type:complete len:457 (+),score=91.90 TRINITY_DN29181_c0_g1_i1:77-1447(+)